MAQDIGTQILSYGKKLHPNEIVARINEIDANQIQSTAKRFFEDRDIAITAIGSIFEIPDYQTLRRQTFDFGL